MSSHWKASVLAGLLLLGCVEESTDHLEPIGWDDSDREEILDSGAGSGQDAEPESDSEPATDPEEPGPIAECGGSSWSGLHPGPDINPWDDDDLINCELISESWDCQLAADEEAVVALVNQLRAEEQQCGNQSYPAVAPLQHEPLMQCASRLHAWDQQYRNYYDHTSPEGHGPGYRMAKTGAGNTAAENIFMTTSGPEGTVAGWMNSPDHCANIMNGSYSKIGVGRYGGHWVMKLIW